MIVMMKEVVKMQVKLNKDMFTNIKTKAKVTHLLNIIFFGSMNENYFEIEIEIVLK